MEQHFNISILYEHFNSFDSDVNFVEFYFFILIQELLINNITVVFTDNIY